MNKEQLEKIVEKMEQGLSKKRIQLGGTERHSTASHVIGGNYFEGTSIPAGSTSIQSIYDSEGRAVSELDEADLNQGAVIHKEVAQGGERYEHKLYYVTDKGSIQEIITMHDPSGKLVLSVDNPRFSKYVQQWYYFAYENSKEDIARRHVKNKKIDDFVIIPFNLKYDGGIPNPKVPMQDGLVYHNIKTGDTLKIERTERVAERNFYYKDSKINIKKDSLELNGKEIMSVGGNIDIVKTQGQQLYIVESELIDFFYKDIGGVDVFEDANPTDLEDKILKREYEQADYQAGPQMRHTIYTMNLKDKTPVEIGSLTDSSHSGYEYTFQPAKQGIKAISRHTKKETGYKR